MKSIFVAFFWAFFVAISLLGISAHGAAKINPPGQFFPVYNYQDDWLVYNETYKNYVPYSQGINEGTRFASLYIDLVKNRKYSLLLHSNSESYLFLEGALQSRIPGGKWQELNLDSLYRIHRKDELLLTIYGSPGIGDKTVILCNKKKRTDSESISPARSGFINIKPISFTPFGSFAGLALILVLILNAWIFNLNPLLFIRLINPIEFFNNDPRDQLSKINKPYSNTVIFFVAISSMMMAFTVIYLSINRINLFSVSTLLSDKVTTPQILGDFSVLTVVFFMLIYAKYIFMALAGNMLNLDKQVDIIFIKIVQSSYLFYAFVFLVILGLHSNHINWIEGGRPYALLPFLFFYVARFIALYVVAKPAGSLINLYLFSYLCVIEIIPLIVSMKFAL